MYAFYAYTWLLSARQGTHPEKVRGTRATLSGCASLFLSTQGYAKDAYPWLIYLHRSAVS